MNARYWIAIGAILGGLAVIAGAIGAHALPESSALAVPARIYNTGQLYHALHALAIILAGLATLFLEGKEAPFAKGSLQFAAIAFTAGIVCFSGGIYVQALMGFASSGESCRSVDSLSSLDGPLSQLALWQCAVSIPWTALCEGALV